MKVIVQVSSAPRAGWYCYLGNEEWVELCELTCSHCYRTDLLLPWWWLPSVSPRYEEGIIAAVHSMILLTGNLGANASIVNHSNLI